MADIRKKSKHGKKRDASKSFETKMLGDVENPNYVDMLSVDKPIAGQNFVCLSFCSPETILKEKQLFFFEEFLKKWEFTKALETYAQFNAFVSHKYNININDLAADFDGFIQEERERLAKSSVDDDFKTFMDRNEESLQKKFDIAHKFQTNVRGLKIRGTYATEEEAAMRAKLLREAENGAHDILVGQVGVWMPWEPDAYKTGRVEFLEEELNQLMHEKKKNEDNAKAAFDQRVKDTKQKAIDENVSKARRSGNVLSQTIDENGNLIGVGVGANAGVIESSEAAISTADVCAELFEGDNIVTGATDHGQSELLSGPYALPKRTDTA